ncbi:hypothetical protein Tco_1314654 [Tanacetum coccineum]
MAWTRVIFLLPVPCSVIFASILPLVRLLLVLIVLGSVIQLPLVLSLAFRKSADLFMHTFLKLHYWTLTLEVFQTSTLITGVSSLIPSNSRIPTLPGHVANLLAIPVLYSTLPIVVTFPLSFCSSNSVMPALANGDRGVWCQIDIRTARNLVSKDKMIWYREGSAGARCSSSSSVLLYPSQLISSLSSSDARYYIVTSVQQACRIEDDPSLVPLAPHQKLTGISMARN